MAWKRSGVQFPLAPPRNLVRAYAHVTVCEQDNARPPTAQGPVAQTVAQPLAARRARLPWFKRTELQRRSAVPRCPKSSNRRSDRNPRCGWLRDAATRASCVARRLRRDRPPRPGALGWGPTLEQGANHGVALGGCCDPANCLGDAPILGETRGGEDARQVRRVRHGLVYFQRRSACAAHL